MRSALGTSLYSRQKQMFSLLENWLRIHFPAGSCTHRVDAVAL